MILEQFFPESVRSLIQAEVGVRARGSWPLDRKCLFLLPPITEPWQPELHVP